MTATLDDALKALPAPPTVKWPNGVWDKEVMRHGTMAVSLFAPRGEDYQTPHLQDELYSSAMASRGQSDDAASRQILMHAIHPGNAPHYVWGKECDGWRLADNEALGVIEEMMPSGASETLHRHAQARQFFYVLAGEASMEIDRETVVIGAGQGLEVPPGTPHRIYNWRADPLRFLVISTPNTRGDRVEAVTGSDA